MAKSVTSIRLENDLLKRLDKVAEARGQTRSELMERILESQVRDEEKLIEEMNSPVMRLLVRTLMNNPRVVKGLAKLVGEDVTDEQVAKGKVQVENVIRYADSRRDGRKERGKRKTVTE